MPDQTIQDPDQRGYDRPLPDPRVKPYGRAIDCAPRSTAAGPTRGEGLRDSAGRRYDGLPLPRG